MRGLLLLAGAALLALWIVLLRPQSLGGSVGYMVVAGDSMLPGLRAGDLVVVRRQVHYRRGDVVAYRVPAGEPAAGGRVIHRIVGGSAANGYVLRGDNKTYDDPWRPTLHDVLGRDWIRLPRVGVIFVLARSPLALGAIAAGIVFAIIVVGAPGAAEEENRATRTTGAKGRQLT